MVNSDAAQQLDELTYERQDISDLSINLKMLEQYCPLARPSSTSGLNTASFQHLGQLDLLPLEIIQSILQQLDLYTLALMQSINHRSKLLVDSLPQHREIVTHAPNALRAILSTGLAPHFTIHHLSRALRAQDCLGCGSFGAYLYLLDCRRYCWLCLAEASDTFPISRSTAKASFGLSNYSLRQLPCMKTLPGRYSLNRFDGDTHNRRLALVSTKSAKEAGIKLHGSQDAMEAPRMLVPLRRHHHISGEGIFFWLQLRRSMQSRPLCSHDGGYAFQRFMASMRFPTLDPSNGTIEWGISCKGCWNRLPDGDILRDWECKECHDGSPNDDISRDWEAMYTKRGYLVHFEQCEHSKHLLTSLKTDGLERSETS